MKVTEGKGTSETNEGPWIQRSWRKGLRVKRYSETNAEATKSTKSHSFIVSPRRKRNWMDWVTKWMTCWYFNSTNVSEQCSRNPWIKLISFNSLGLHWLRYYNSKLIEQLADNIKKWNDLCLEQSEINRMKCDMNVVKTECNESLSNGMEVRNETDWMSNES